MKRVYLILGEDNVGKSTLIRSLTGVRKANHVNIEYSDKENFLFWVWMTSLQEPGQMRRTPKELIEMLSSTHDAYRCLLIPLRIRGLSNEYPDAQVYINHLLEKFEIMGAVILGQNTNSLQLPISPLVISNSKSNAPNAIAKQVREKWGWL